jgi:hypothetical protein
MPERAAFRKSSVPARPSQSHFTGGMADRAWERLSHQPFENAPQDGDVSFRGTAHNVPLGMYHTWQRGF